MSGIGRLTHATFAGGVSAGSVGVSELGALSHALNAVTLETDLDLHTPESSVCTARCHCLAHHLCGADEMHTCRLTQTHTWPAVPSSAHNSTLLAARHVNTAP